MVIFNSYVSLPEGIYIYIVCVCGLFILFCDYQIGAVFILSSSLLSSLLFSSVFFSDC